MRTPTHFTDDQLIKLYIDGDNNAFTTIVTRHKSKIYTSIFLLIKDTYLAEDIFQDVFIRIIDSIKSGGYKGEEKSRNFDRLVNRALAEELISLSKAATIWNISINELRKGFTGVR